MIKMNNDQDDQGSVVYKCTSLTPLSRKISLSIFQQTLLHTNTNIIHFCTSKATGIWYVYVTVSLRDIQDPWHLCHEAVKQPGILIKIYYISWTVFLYLKLTVRLLTKNNTSCIHFPWQLINLSTKASVWKYVRCGNASTLLDLTFF